MCHNISVTSRTFAAVPPARCHGARSRAAPLVRMHQRMPYRLKTLSAAFMGVCLPSIHTTSGGRLAEACSAAMRLSGRSIYYCLFESNCWEECCFASTASPCCLQGHVGCTAFSARLCPCTLHTLPVACMHKYAQCLCWPTPPTHYQPMLTCKGAMCPQHHNRNTTISQGFGAASAYDPQRSTLVRESVRAQVW